MNVLSSKTFFFPGEDNMLGDQSYRYLTADEMKSLGDDSLPIDVTKDERAVEGVIHKDYIGKKHVNLDLLVAKAQLLMSEIFVVAISVDS